MPLSRGAKQCLRLLESYAARSGVAFPYRKTMCAQLEVSMKTLEGYITELRKAGIVSSKKRQHSSAEYRISRPLEIQGSVQGSVQGSEGRYIGRVKVSETEMGVPVIQRKPQDIALVNYSIPTEEELQEAAGNR